MKNTSPLTEVGKPTPSKTKKWTGILPIKVSSSPQHKGNLPENKLIFQPLFSGAIAPLYDSFREGTSTILASAFSNFKPFLGFWGLGTRTTKKQLIVFWTLPLFARDKPQKTNATQPLFLLSWKKTITFGEKKASSLNSQKPPKLGVVHSHPPPQKKNNPLFFRFGDLNKKPQTFFRRFPKTTHLRKAPCEAMSAKLHGVLSNRDQESAKRRHKFWTPEGAAGGFPMGFYAWRWSPPKKGEVVGDAFLFWFSKTKHQHKQGKNIPPKYRSGWSLF